MSQEILRKLCAEKAMEYIKDNDVIGLGAGRNIACLIELIKDRNSKIKVVTPSEITKNLCIRAGIEILSTNLVESIDVAFDGCGEVNSNFYASKGGGGIFTKEKIIASMAKEYILLVDSTKIKKELSYHISIEVIKDSLRLICKKVKALNGNPVVRTSNNKEGYLITDDGNYIVDISFDYVEDFKKLNNQLIKIPGVVETSIFINEVTKLILAEENGVKVLAKLADKRGGGLT